MDSNFCAFWLAPVTRNILGYSLFYERKEKWCVVSRKFQKKKLKQHFFYPSDLVNTKTTIPLRVGEEQWIYTSTLRVSVYIHRYSPPLRGIVVYYLAVLDMYGVQIICLTEEVVLGCRVFKMYWKPTKILSLLLSFTRIAATTASLQFIRKSGWEKRNVQDTKVTYYCKFPIPFIFFLMTLVLYEV